MKTVVLIALVLAVAIPQAFGQARPDDHDPEPAIPALIDRFLQTECFHDRIVFRFGYFDSPQRALVRIGGPSVPFLLKILDAPDEAKRICAAEALGEIGPAARDAVPRLIQAVERPEPGENGETLRRIAITALGRIGPDARAIEPTLMGWLGGDVIEDQLSLVVALDRIGANPSAKLVDMFLRDGDDLAFSGLCYLGPKAKAEIPRLQAAMADKLGLIRVEAAIILVHIDPAHRAAFAVLLQALNQPESDRFTFSNVSLTLSSLGPAAKVAMPRLIELARTSEIELRDLMLIDPDDPAFLSLLIDLLKNEHEFVVHEAASCLGLLGSRARPAVPALVESLRHPVGERTMNGHNLWTTNESLIRALGRIDPEDPPVLAALSEILQKEPAFEPSPFPGEALRVVDDPSFDAAAKVLGSIGPAAKPAVPALVAWLRKSIELDLDFEEVVRALGKIGPEASEALPVLRELAGGKSGKSAVVLIAVHRIDATNPEWRNRLEKLLERADKPGDHRASRYRAIINAKILSALGRSSAETDRFVRETLDGIEKMFLDDDPWDPTPSENLEDWLENLGSYGPSAREAIPRLKEYQRHRDPWVRLWATETLRQIAPVK